MRCPHCGHDNAVQMNFCGECGTRLAALCRECGARNAPAQKFCGECGARLEPGASSRQCPSPHEYTRKHLAEKILTSKTTLEGVRALAETGALVGKTGAYRLTQSLPPPPVRLFRSSSPCLLDPRSPRLLSLVDAARARGVVSGSYADIGRAVVSGMLICVAALALLFAAPDGLPPVTLALALCGLGPGLFIPPNNSAIMAAAPASLTGEAGGLLNVIRSCGISVGVAAASALLAWRLAVLTGSGHNTLHAQARELYCRRAVT